MDDKAFDSINVIPLVDVMLVLLTIVLTTSTFIAVGAIPVKLPKASSASSEQHKSTTISIDKHGRLFLDGKPESLENMRTELRSRDRNLHVVVRADRTIALQVFVNVMDVVKTLGFHKVSLQTENG